MYSNKVLDKHFVNMTKKIDKPKGRVKDVDVTIGQNLKKIRILKDISQTELADMLGITFQQVQKYESGHNRLSAGSICILSKALNVPILAFYESTYGLLDTKIAPLGSVSKEEAKILSLFAKVKNKSVRKSILKIIKASTGEDS